MSHRCLGFAEDHVCLDNLQHMRGDFIHVFQGPDAERHQRSVVLRQKNKCMKSFQGTAASDNLWETHLQKWQMNKTLLVSLHVPPSRPLLLTQNYEGNLFLPTVERILKKGTHLKGAQIT